MVGFVNHDVDGSGDSAKFIGEIAIVWVHAACNIREEEDGVRFRQCHIRLHTNLLGEWILFLEDNSP